MEKKKNFLQALRKAVYNDVDWEDKAASYVSWLEPESLDDIDCIGHCQECPAGTSFEDLHLTDWGRFVTKRMPGWRCSAGATGWTTI